MSEQRSIILSENTVKAVVELDKTIRETRGAVIEHRKSGNEMAATIYMAAGMNAIRKGLDGIMDKLSVIEGSPLGYTVVGKAEPWQVRDALAVGLLNGLRIINNEINVFNGKFYATKPGIMRQVREWPGIENLRHQLGEPVIEGNVAKVPAWAAWELDGSPNSVDFGWHDKNGQRIVVKYYSSDSPDTIRGKAESKLYRTILQWISGTTLPTQDEAEDDGNTITVQPASEPKQLQPAKHVYEEEPKQLEPEIQTQPETNEPDAAVVMEAYTRALAGSKTLAEAGNAQETFCGPDCVVEWTPAERTTMHQMYSRRCEEIRAERSNRAKQKQMLDTAPTAQEVGE